MKSNSGFSLIEVIVASVSSTILAAALYTLIHTNSVQFLDSSKKNKLETRYGIVTEEIRRMVHHSRHITSQPDGSAIIIVPTDTLEFSRPSQSFVTFRTATGDILGGYRSFSPFSGATYELLHTRLPDGRWDTVWVGSEVVPVIPHPVNILAGRRGIDFTLTLVLVENGRVVDTLNSAGEVVRTRNGY